MVSLGWFYAFFIVSGFCSLTYEVVWLRLAMAEFGVNTPFVSIVLSVFMAGIAGGSFGAGWLSRRLDSGSTRVPLRLYAGCELLIGAAGVAVPACLNLGHRLINQGGAVAWGSGSYYWLSGLWIAVTLLPLTICMGATFPLAMWAIRKSGVAAEPRTFSYLYASNVLGATAGTGSSAFILVEAFGFRGTTYVATGLNVLVAVGAWLLSARLPDVSEPPRKADAALIQRAAETQALRSRGLHIMSLLFLTGLASLGMEVVWTRQFTPYLGTVVYAFSGTLALYLGATFMGSTAYRMWAGRSPSRDLDLAVRVMLWGIALSGLLPIVLSDPRIPLPLERIWGPVRVVLGVVPFCALVGFLSPMLVDRWAAGDPEKAGNAYAVNTFGCIIGPLLASFALLPVLNERWAVLAFLAPLVLGGLLLPSLLRTDRPARRSMLKDLGETAAIAALLVFVVSISRDPEYLYVERVVKRDYTATVVATEVEGHKHLFVNGQSMVYLTPVTKMMAHLPLAMLRQSPRDSLVVCIGMGTSLRSLHSWDISVTAVELVPSVPSLFGYFHKDASTVIADPSVHIEIDDGRRYLERTKAQYDVITIDPPPPVEAAGSSLLYSVEWYALVKKRLRAGGVLQQWLPYGDRATLTAAAKAVTESFPYVRVFSSFEGWGFHIIASMTPLPSTSATALASQLPPAAIADLVEMGPFPTAAAQFQAVLDREVPVEALVGASQGTPTLTDNRPVNEYYLWRRLLRDGWGLYFRYAAGDFVEGRGLAPSP